MQTIFLSPCPHPILTPLVSVLVPPFPLLLLFSTPSDSSNLPCFHFPSSSFPLSFLSLSYSHSYCFSFVNSFLSSTQSDLSVPIHFFPLLHIVFSHSLLFFSSKNPISFSKFEVPQYKVSTFIPSFSPFAFVTPHQNNIPSL